MARGGFGGAEAETVEGEQSVVLSVPGKEDGVEGAFALQGTRLAKDAVLQFSVESKDGSRVQKTFSVKVVGEKPALLVSVSPQSIEALAESRIVFKVTDAATGLPVEDAHVVLGSEFDLFKGAVIEAFAANEEGVVGKAKAGAEKGKYVLSVEPNDAGYIDWKVEADGYRTKRGQIDVSANTVMEFEPKTAALAVDSKTFVSSAVSVRNLLASNARVTLSLVRNSPAAYTTVETDRAAFSLKAGESGQFNLRARVNEFVLGVADTPQILKEDVSGSIRVVARAGSAMQTEEIPFTVKTVYAQQGLGELWSMSADSLDFELRPPQYVSRMQPLTVTNNAPHPVVVNFQPMVPTLFITPLSAVVPAGGSQEFQVISTAAREYLYEGCVMEDKQLQGDVFVYATFQGIRSSKKITTTIDIASSDTCSPKDGVQVTLPTGLYFSLPTGTIIKKNTDGSVAFQLPDGLRALIQGGYVSGSEVIAPAGALLVLPPAWLSSTASLTTAAGPVQRLQLVFPFPTRWEIKSGEKLPAYLSTARPIEFDNARITFPPGTQVNDASLPIANGGLGFSPITATTPVNPNAYYAPLIPAGVQNYPYLPSQAYSLLMQNTYYQRDLKHVASVMAGLPVTIEAARGADSSVIPVTYEQGLPFSFKLEVPGVANMDSATKTIELSQCNRTRVYKGEDLMLVFPAAKRILFPKGGVSFPTAIAAGGRPTSFEVQALKPFTIEYCPGVSGDDKYFTACFQSTTQFMFTEGTEVDRGQYTAVPNTCEKVTLFATDAEKEKEYAGVFVLGASGMRFPPKASLDKSRKTGFLPLTGDAVSSASLLAGACVDFEPCEGFKKGGDLKDKPLVSPAAQFLSVDPKALEFQLSDGKLKESKTVKVLNSGASKLMKVGIYEESLTSQYNDLLIPKETGFAKVVQNAFQPKYDLEGQLKKEGAAGFDYQITVQVPNELKDAHGCIAKSVKIQGRVTIRPENQLAANAVEVPVTVNVAVDEAKCQFAQAKAALAAISDLTVNYGAEEVNDNSPNQKMLLSFKNVGHSRFVTLINNEPAETVAQVGVWPEKNDLLDCKFSKDGKQTDFGDMTEAKPLYIASAGAVILNCTTLTDTGGKPVIYEVNSKDVIVQSKQGGAAPQTVKKKLSVVVYKPEDAVKALYQGTPQGDILRVEKPGFKACEKFYCDYDQAASAFSSLMATLNDYLDKAIIKDDFAKTHAQFCALGVGGDGYRPLQKTITIQLVNSLAVLQFNDAKLRELAGNAFNNQVAGVKVTSPGFKGCGIYKVTATVMAWCGALGEGETWADWKKRTTIQVSAEPLVGCGEYFTPQNALANAAILMRESYEGFSGLQVTHWPSEAIEPIKALLNLKLPFGSMHLGTYKNQTDEKDKQNLNSVFSTLFNSPLQEKGDSRWSFPDYYYPEDQHYCLNSAWSGPLPTFFAELPFVLGAEALATGGAALGGVAASALTLTAPFCAVSVVSPLVSKINWCQAGCGCLTGLWGLLLPLKGAKGIGTFVTDIGAKKLAGLTVLNLGAAVASTATENEYSGEIAGTSFGASFALTKYPEILKGARLELLKKLRRTLVGVTDEEIITITDSLIGTTPDVAAAATAGGGATSAAAFDAARIQVMKAFGKTYGGATLTTEQAKNILAYQTAINKGDVATFEKYLEILEKDGTSGVYDKMKVALAPRISRGGSVVGRRGADLLATVDVTAEQVAQQSAGLIQKIGKSFYLGGAAWKFVAGAAKVGAFLQLLAFNCNLEPVEAKLDPDKLNHAVVFHHETRTFYDEAQRTETGSDPTIYRWSYGNHNELLQANCPPGWKACLKLRYDDFLKDKQLGLQGGLLIIGLGNEVTNPAELLSSVFLPDTAPVKKETLGITEKTSAAVTVAPGAAAESGGGI
ncbi:MAG: hypothetical protein NTY90_05410 [Candidatus Micrarchaeota archaeon]|nr:hypothetical protein [Candidatus Micrarchaeota archaeon]